MGARPARAQCLISCLELGRKARSKVDLPLEDKRDLPNVKFVLGVKCTFKGA